jgi:uncharacterized membrane protein
MAVSHVGRGLPEVRGGSVFDEINGLPAHPLIVHGVVVLVPLLCLSAIAYALVPRIRGLVWWAAAGLAIVAPVFAWVATSSGGSLATSRYRDQIPEQVLDHQKLGDMTFRVSLILGVATLLLVVLTSARFTSNRRVPPWLSIALSVIVVLLAVANIYYVVRTGDSGAQSVWGGS